MIKLYAYVILGFFVIFVDNNFYDFLIILNCN